MRQIIEFRNKSGASLDIIGGTETHMDSGIQEKRED